MSLQFFKASLDKPIVVDCDDIKYIGVLGSAPDTTDGEFIVMSSVSIIPKPVDGAESGPPEALPLVDQMLVRLDKVVRIQLLKPQVLKKKG